MFTGLKVMESPCTLVRALMEKSKNNNPEVRQTGCATLAVYKPKYKHTSLWNKSYCSIYIQACFINMSLLVLISFCQLSGVVIATSPSIKMHTSTTYSTRTKGVSFRIRLYNIMVATRTKNILFRIRLYNIIVVTFSHYMMRIFIDLFIYKPKFDITVDRNSEIFYYYQGLIRGAPVYISVYKL
jgi:hypothetical protein